MKKIDYSSKGYIAVFLLFLSVSGIVTAEPVGKVVYTFGDVSAIAANGDIRQINKGDEVFSGDQLHTGNGRVQVSFIDGAYISVQPNSDYKIENYQYAGKQDGSELAIYRLIKGGVRAVTGLIGKKNRDAYKVHTAVATIGIRGTGHNTRICQGDCFSTDGEALLDGLYHTTWEGVTFVVNDVGSVDVQVGQSIIVTGIDVPIQRVRTQSAITAAQETVPQPGEEEEEEFTFQTGEQFTSEIQTTVFNPTIQGAAGFLLFPNGFIDGITDASVTSDLTGVEFTSLTTGERLLVLAGTVQIVDVFSDGIIFMNRWTNGTLGGTSNGVPFTFTLLNNQSIHTIVAASAVPVPVTGSASYSFLAGTSSTTPTGATIGNGITSGTIGVNFLSANVSLNMNVNHASTNYTVSGSSAIFNFTSGTFSADLFDTGTISTTGGGCGGGCSTTVAGFFAGGETTVIGSTPNRIGLEYAFFEPVLNDGIGGAGAFTLASVSP